MILNTTSDTFEILLGGTVATTQPTFTCGFNEMSSTTLVPKVNNGSTNNTTPVTLVSAPSSSFQRQVKYINIENNDTAAVTVTIRFNNSSVTRNIFKAILLAGENLSYEAEKGWNVFNSNGFIEFDTVHVNRVGNIMWPEGTCTSTFGASTALGNTPNIVSIGRIPKSNSTSINFLYRNDQNGTTITWAEMGVYKIGTGGMACPNQARVFTRMGSTSTSAVWNTTGIKNTQVSISNYFEGDHVYVIFAQNATTGALLPVGTTDQTNSTLVYAGNTTSATAWRPSTNLTFTIASFATSPTLLIFQIN
jgi:hypothetical protein